MGIPLYPTGRSHLDRAVWVRVRVRVRVGLAHSCMYCDQPSLLTRDPGGGVNEEIPHRWAKQPALTYDVLSIHRENGNGTKNTRKKRHLQINKMKHVWLSGHLHIEERLNKGPRLQ